MLSHTSALTLCFSFLLLAQKKRNKEKGTFLKAFFGQGPKIEFDFLNFLQGFENSQRKSNSMLAKKTVY